MVQYQQTEGVIAMRPKRSNGMGTLVLKPSGTYSARWMWKGHIFTKTTGERDRRKALVALERITRPFRDRREQEVLEQIQTQVLKLTRQNAPIEQPQVRPLPPEDLFETWRKAVYDGTMSDESMDLYAQYTRALVEWCRENGIEDARGVTRQDAKRFLVDISPRMGSRSLNFRMSFLRRMWMDLRDEWKLDPEVWNQKKARVKGGTNRKAFTLEQVSAIVDACREDAEMSLLVTIGLYTGLRLGDAANLSWESVDLRSGMLRIKADKDEEDLEIPIHRRLHDELARRWSEGASGHVSQYNAMQYRNNRLSCMFTDVLERVGLRSTALDENGKKIVVYGFHSFRHFFISWALNAGMPPAVIQQIVGHSSFTTTLRYLHKDIAAMREGIAKMPDFC